MKALTEFTLYMAGFMIILSCGFYIGQNTQMPYKTTYDSIKVPIEEIKTVPYSTDKINYQVRKIRWCGSNATLSNAVGMSMFPYSWEGGFHWSEPVNFSQIELGDVITYQDNESNKTIHHAVCNLYNDYLIPCGYNNLAMDGKVFPEQILSRDCFKG